VRVVFLLPLILACTQSHEFVASDKGETDADADSDSDTDTDTDSDTDSDVDADGDGFTVEDGDCDDGDIAVNPGREEDPSDGKDNDCDGRIDEKWSGMTVGLQSESGRSSLLVYDTVGRVEEEIKLDDGCIPYSLDHGIDGGWVAVTYPEYINISAMAPAPPESADVVEIDEEGHCTVLASFDDESYWWGPPIRGVRAHPDGYYVVAGPGALYRVDRDGTMTELASWGWDYTDEKLFDLYAMDLSVDLLTGEVGIVDLLGGFATWSEGDGLVFRKKADITGGWENWDWLVGVAGTKMDSGGWWSLQVDYETGEYALYRFNEDTGDWVSRMEWVDSNFIPLLLAEDGDHGEFYVTAKGGDHRTIWRIREEGDLVDDFVDEVEDGYNLWGIVSDY